MAHKFACLTYHVIGETAGQYALSEDQLRAQLALLKAEGYVVDDFEGLESRLRSGQPTPRLYAVIAVDDGHESAMRAADVLQSYGCRATFFLTRDRCLYRPDFIRESQIRELRQNFSLGTHGTTHRKLTFLAEEECIRELKESKQWLQDVTGLEVRYMAAPGGYINSPTLRIAYECGYILTGTCREWMNSPDMMTLPGTVNRVNIRQHFSLQDFRNAVQGHSGFYRWRQIRAMALAVPKQLLR